MRRSITIGQDAYNLLVSLKTGPGDSFTKVILRHMRKPADNCGELLEAIENLGVPPVETEAFDRLAAARGRRSGRK